MATCLALESKKKTACGNLSGLRLAKREIRDLGFES